MKPNARSHGVLQMKKTLLIILLWMVAIQTVSATLVPIGQNTAFNTSGTMYESSYIHDTSYVPEEYVWIAIVLGLACLAISVFTPKDLNIFVLITPVFWGYAAWFSAFMTRGSSVPLSSVDCAGVTTLQLVNTDIIYPQPVLQYAMIFLFLLSIVYMIYVLFLRQPDERYDTAINIR